VTILLMLWAVVMATFIAFAIPRPRQGGQLTLAYLLGLSLIHVPGLLPYLDLASDANLFGLAETQAGMKLTLIGMVAFVLGATAVRRIYRPQQRQVPTAADDGILAHMSWRVLWIGIASYFFLMPLSFLVPSLTSVVSPLGTLLIIGVWLRLYEASVKRNGVETLSVFALLPLLPLATLASGGFIGYGISWILSVIAFQFVMSRNRLRFYIASPLVVFLGLSLFVTYMGQRAGIRDLIWEQHAGLVDRLERITSMVTDFEFLNINSPSQMARLDDRLNQSALVGVGVIRHETGDVDFVYGATLPVWALVPRALWPEKPDIGGGASVVSDFTGLPVAQGTSVGVGQVLEFYMNFGVPGVIVGFIALGGLLMWFDLEIAEALSSRDVRGLLLRGIPGLTLVEPQGNLMEIFVGFAAAVVASRIIVSLPIFRVPPPGQPLLGRNLVARVRP
jgi:hypothetical protein